MWLLQDVLLQVVMEGMVHLVLERQAVKGKQLAKEKVVAQGNLIAPVPLVAKGKAAVQESLLVPEKMGSK